MKYIYIYIYKDKRTLLVGSTMCRLHPLQRNNISTLYLLTKKNKTEQKQKNGVLMTQTRTGCREMCIHLSESITAKFTLIHSFSFSDVSEIDLFVN